MTIRSKILAFASRTCNSFQTCREKDSSATARAQSQDSPKAPEMAVDDARMTSVSLSAQQTFSPSPEIKSKNPVERFRKLTSKLFTYVSTYYQHTTIDDDVDAAIHKKH